MSFLMRGPERSAQSFASLNAGKINLIFVFTGAKLLHKETFIFRKKWHLAVKSPSAHTVSPRSGHSPRGGGPQRQGDRESQEGRQLTWARHTRRVRLQSCLCSVLTGTQAQTVAPVWKTGIQLKS